MRGVLIDENQFTASKHVYRDETCVMSNSWYVRNKDLAIQ